MLRGRGFGRKAPNRRAVRGGITAPSVNAGVIVQEGDSITAWPTTGHATLWGIANPSFTRNNLAVGGSVLADLITRKATARGYDAEVVTVLIGANDDITDGTAYFNSVMAYAAPFRTDGAKIVVGTILPKGTSQAGYAAHNTGRATFNALLKAAQGSQVDAVADYDSTALGTDAAANDTTLFSDGLHPTDGTGTPTSDGQELYMLPQYSAAINYARGIANQVKQFTFTHATGVVASATSTSNAVTIIGLAYGESKTYSVSGGEVRKNPGAWGTSGGTVVNGDTLQVRGTASATALATVNVVLTVGSVTDTYSIQTASAASPLTTTYRSSAAGNGGFGANFTFSSVTFYAGENIIAIPHSVGSAAPTAVSLGGTAGTKLAEIVGGAGGSSRNISFWKVTKGSGGSGNLVITAPVVYAIAYALWSTDAGASFVAAASADYQYRDNPTQTSATIAIPSGGSVLTAFHTESISTDIVPATGNAQDAEVLDPGNWDFWFGHLTSGSQPAVSTTSDGSTSDPFKGSQMLAISLQP